MPRAKKPTHPKTQAAAPEGAAPAPARYTPTQILALELAYAGMQTLMEDYGWRQEDAARWCNQMLDRANATRAQAQGQPPKETTDG